MFSEVITIVCFFQPHLLVQMKIHVPSKTLRLPRWMQLPWGTDAAWRWHFETWALRPWLKRVFFAAAGGGRGGGDAETISFYSGKVFLGIVTMLFPTSLKSKGIMPLQVLSPGFLWIFDMESVLSGLVLSWFETTFSCKGNRGTSWDQLPRSCMMYI